ncbi:hypothetical protein EDD18DRAFT_1110335 [Armillaria luteobubalina]|uniref:Uncharacterized protein n=1 Tax=Armillaria luteobubalina TaxID=153913 RepID=A0AA39PPY0_9AGAR|nr:hypothetical protein EDD18DRAFT_1110335 [Armillaria luteobubalina]
MWKPTGGSDVSRNGDRSGYRIAYSGRPYRGWDCERPGPCVRRPARGEKAVDDSIYLRKRPVEADYMKEAKAVRRVDDDTVQEMRACNSSPLYGSDMFHYDLKFIDIAVQKRTRDWYRVKEGGVEEQSSRLASLERVESMYALWSLRLPTAPRPAPSGRVIEYRSLSLGQSKEKTEVLEMISKFTSPDEIASSITILVASTRLREPLSCDSPDIHDDLGMAPSAAAFKREGSLYAIFSAIVFDVKDLVQLHPSNGNALFSLGALYSLQDKSHSSPRPA